MRLVAGLGRDEAGSGGGHPGDVVAAFEAIPAAFAPI